MFAKTPGGVQRITGSLDDIAMRNINTIEEYEVIPETAFVSILEDEKELEYIYFVVEPEINPREERIISQATTEIERMIPLLVDSDSLTSYEQLEALIEEFISLHHPEYDENMKKKLAYSIRKGYGGFGKMHVMVQDKNVEDISCNGPGSPVFVYHRKYGSLKTNISYGSETELSSTLVKLAQICGKEVSVNTPILDGITMQGHRVQGMYGKEISPKGTALTIRLFREKPFTPVDLVKSGAASPEMIAYFWYMIEYLQSALMVGPPAVGKTSTLNSILMLVPPNTKVFSIEETRELNIMHPNWVAASTRESNVSSAKLAGSPGKIDLFELVKMAMRQRPTYLVVGEVRGKEAYTLFQAMSTGHTTYSTMHADSMSTLLNRLESEPLNVPRILVASLGTVILSHFIRRGQMSLRRITEINEIVGIDKRTNDVIYNKVFSYNSGEDSHSFTGQSTLLNRIAEARNIPLRSLLREFEERTRIIEKMAESGYEDYSAVWEMINGYYNSRKAVEKGESEH